MHYKLTYSSPTTTFSEEIKDNQENVSDRAWDILEEADRTGRVVIERRHSSYYGDYKHYMTVGYSKEITEL